MNAVFVPRRLPPAPFFRDLVLTSLWFWVGLRVAFAIGGGFSGLRSPVVAVAVLLLVGLLGHLDRKSRGLSISVRLDLSRISSVRLHGRAAKRRPVAAGRK